ncbi:uncharacterized protein LOC141913136 [Tubulanus polymorphus]|uniref:uncharacterized protein LOC141913136 n=1 Tax=Tubulanus polymorphus TaxID=672921 RepID=UPI003DA45573
MAFDVYESPDGKGMPADEWTLLRCMKMSDRTISPLRLKHMIRSMQSQLNEKSRLQLYEYLDIILWSRTFTKMDQRTPNLVQGRNHREIFKLDDFHTILKPFEVRVTKDLDKVFIEESYKKSMDMKRALEKKDKVKKLETSPLKDNARWHHPIPVENPLKAEVRASTSRLQSAAAGYVRGIDAYDEIDRVHSAPTERSNVAVTVTTSVTEAPDSPQQMAPSEIHIYTPEPSDDKSTTIIAETVRPHTSYETMKRLVKEQFTTTPNNPSQNCQEVLEDRPQVIQFSMPEIRPSVTVSDVLQQKNRVDRLKFQFESADERYLQSMEADMELLRPGICNRLDERKKANIVINMKRQSFKTGKDFFNGQKLSDPMQRMWIGDTRLREVYKRRCEEGRPFQVPGKYETWTWEKHLSRNSKPRGFSDDGSTCNIKESSAANKSNRDDVSSPACVTSSGPSSRKISEATTNDGYGSSSIRTTPAPPSLQSIKNILNSEENASKRLRNDKSRASTASGKSGAKISFSGHNGSTKYNYTRIIRPHTAPETLNHGLKNVCIKFV